MKKADKILELIVQAQDEVQALEVLKKTLDELYITSDYTFLVSLKDKIISFEKQFEALTGRYKSAEITYDFVDEVRTECAFLYREVNDELSFDINRLKIFYENDKTIKRYDAMANLQKDNPFNTKSASAVRELIGGDPGYREYVSLASISYGLYKQLGGLLEAMKLFSDSLASRARREFEIESRDVK